MGASIARQRRIGIGRNDCMVCFGRLGKVNKLLFVIYENVLSNVHFVMGKWASQASVTHGTVRGKAGKFGVLTCGNKLASQVTRA